ncbi:MAG: hypothetical protein FWD60_02395 [Candidatus Azobacteroides sp.]|nr:hypothetical protein [Candidatus Azobacteroides sp.]
MEANKQELETLQDIRKIMERSSRFISLSGWSGVSAGICALIGAFFAHRVMTTGNNYVEYCILNPMTISLLIIAVLTFAAAFVSAFFFTYIRSKRNNIPIWGTTAKRLMWNVGIPMTAGGFLILKMIEMGAGGLIAPACLIVYGISLFSGSKQTLDEIRYLGYTEIILGIIALWNIGHGLFFWTIGFGVMHIVYGVYMWIKYERK